MARTADVLIKLGNEAARRFISEKVPLNDSVSQYRMTMGLNDEETLRVIENANRSAFTNLWHSAPVNDRVITFPLADATAILGSAAKPEGQMAKAASAEPHMDEIGFYRPATDGYRVSHRTNAEYNAFMEKGASALEKQASAGPTRREVSLHTALNQVRRDFESARQAHTVACVEHLDARSEFRKAAALALRLHPVEHVVSCLLPFTKEAQAECLEEMKPEIDRLRELGLVKEGELCVAEPNPNHPIVRSFVRFTKADDVLKKTASALDAAEFEYTQLRKEVGRAVRA